MDSSHILAHQKVRPFKSKMGSIHDEITKIDVVEIQSEYHATE